MHRNKSDKEELLKVNGKLYQKIGFTEEKEKEKIEDEDSGEEIRIEDGSSLTVFPASNMINYFRGKYLVILNRDKTPYDNYANLVIHDNLAKVSRKVMDKIRV